MAKAVIPRMQGDDYQARFFWLQACRLFLPDSKVLRVGYELDDVAFFDDVATFYSEPIPDVRGGLACADYYQVKFHVDQSRPFTWKALMDPDYIRAKKSLLERLRAAQVRLAPQGEGCRFWVVAPSAVHPDDELAELISNQTGELRLHLLFDSTTERSAMGRIRAAWRKHLGVADDAELQCVLRPLRIMSNAGDLNWLRERLNDRLALAGLRRIEEQSQVSPYDDLIRKLRATGRSQFTREEIRETCEREGLWCGSQMPIQQAVQLGVRSFMRWAEYMEDETDHMLCLVQHFDNRSIRDPRMWQETVFPALARFLSDNVRRSNRYHLHLDAHASIAFAAGYCLPAKSGVDVTPVQKTGRGRAAWQPACDERGGNVATWAQVQIKRDSKENHVAIAVSATHDVLDDVRVYVDANLPEVRRIVSLAAPPKPSPTAVRNATHAFTLAQEVAFIAKERMPQEREGKLHIFIAAPNALVFYLGQLAHGFGCCVLYEYGFESNSPGRYEPSMKFPPLWP